MSYFWKTKTREKISFKDFVKRWKEGLTNITPLQKTKVQLTGTKITLLGLFLGLCVSIYGWKNLWWVGIILIGAIINTGVQYLATKQQKKLYQTIENNFKEATEADNSPQEPEVDGGGNTELHHTALNVSSISEDAKEKDEEKKGVYIERAAKLDEKGIKAICGTEEEYDKYVKEEKDKEVKTK